MRLTIRLLVVGFSLTLAGCETARNEVAVSVREKFTGPTYVRRSYAADTRTVFESARASVERLGFRITRAGVAQGVIEGVSRLATDDDLRGSRQHTVKIQLVTTLDGGTEVAVLFTEVIEANADRGVGQGIESPLRNHPLYESFFVGLSQLSAR